MYKTSEPSVIDVAPQHMRQIEEHGRNVAQHLRQETLGAGNLFPFDNTSMSL